MMGISDPQPSMFYHINLEQFVTADHPMRKIRPLIDTARLRQLCEPLEGNLRGEFKGTFYFSAKLTGDAEKMCLPPFFALERELLA